MKITLTVLLALLVTASVSWADNIGTMFGSLSTAQAGGKGQTTLSGMLGVTDFTSFGGSLTYGVADRTDFRVKLGVGDEDYFNAAVLLGADVKWQLWDATSMTPGVKQKPMDLAVGGFMEWSSWSAETQGTFIESERVFEAGFQVTGSRTYQMNNGTTWTPYGRANLRYERLSVNFAPGTFGDASDGHMAVGLNGGVAWGVSQRVSLFGELQIDGNDGLFFGMNYRM